jgi:2-oxoglutarate ferredoxin oxidoreductase subunit delta
MAKKNTVAKIDKERCKGCLLCIEVCPRHALEISKEVNKRGLQYVAMKDPDKCTGCGLCYIMCPDCAIEIRER